MSKEFKMPCVYTGESSSLTEAKHHFRMYNARGNKAVIPENSHITPPHFRAPQIR
jgi:hypothetical protein